MSQDAPKQGPRPGGASRGPRTFTLTFTAGRILGFVLFACIGLVWVFILGVMLGRGQSPEARIPELERLMPQAAQTNAPRVIAPDVPRPDPAAQAANAAQVISSAELAYHDILKRTGQPASRSGAAPRTPKPAEQPKPAEAPASSAQPAKEQFLYVYQVAAYKDASSSDALAAKLKKNGIAARTEKSVEKGKAWYKTVVDFKGTPEDTQKLRAKLAAQNFDRLILKSKKPAK